MRRVVASCLKDLGMTNIQTAEDGLQAWELLQQDDFEFVITDWDMPNMSGLELLQKIRSTPKYKELPVIMVTAEGLQEKIIEAIRAGVNNYIVKPIDVEKLREKMVKIFGS